MKMFDSLNNEDRAAISKLMKAIAISGTFMIIELIAGKFAHSLALMADAAHVLSDVSSFVLSAYAICLAARPGSERLTYGHGRAEVLVALVSILTIWAISIGLLKEAIHRLLHDHQEINPKIILSTGIFGLLSNIVLMLTLGGHSHNHNHDHDHDHDHIHLGWEDIAPAWLVKSKKKDDDIVVNNDVYKPANDVSDTENAICESNSEVHYHDSEHNELHRKERNMNIQAAYLHALGDLLQNIGVIIAGISLLIFPKALWIDPAITILFALIVIYSTFGLLQSITSILLQKTPEDLNLVDLEHDLLSLPNVHSVHDIHAWSVRAGKPQFTCHIRTIEEDGEKTLINATRLLHEKYRILHTTIQIDNSDKSQCFTRAHEACHVHACQDTCDEDIIKRFSRSFNLINLQREMSCQTY